MQNVSQKVAMLLMICGLVNIDFVLNNTTSNNIVNVGLFWLACVLIILSSKKISRNIFIAVIIPVLYFILNITYESIYFLFFIFYMILGFYLGSVIKEIDIEKLAKKLFFSFILLESIVLITKGSLFVLQSDSLRLISTAGGPPETSFILLIFSVIFLSFSNWKFYIPSVLLLILTGHRISILALVICTLYFMAVSKNNRNQLIFLGLCMSPLILFFSGKILSLLRFKDKYGDLNTGTLDGRLVHWNWALHKFEHAPLFKKIFGHGINSTKEIFFTGNYYLGENTGSGAMHNEYLRLLIETGLSIFPVLLFLIVLVLKKSLVLSQSNSRIVIGLLISMLVCALTDNILYSYSSFMFASLFLIGHLAFNENHYVIKSRNK